MILKRYKNLGIVLLFLFLTSCNRYYYKPSVQNVPLFSQKDETRLTASYSGGDEVKSLELQGAYSLGHHLAIMGNYMYAKGGKTDNNWGKGYYLDAAAGYYNPFYGDFVFEVYGGLGLSNQHQKYGDASNSTSDLSFYKIYAQPSIGIKRRGLEVAVSGRVAWLNFTRVSNKVQTSDWMFEQVNDINHHRSSFLLEPALTTRWGWNRLKVQIQVSDLINLNNPDLAFVKGQASIGLQFGIGPKVRE